MSCNANSTGKRLWSVPQRRSTRPFAWGLIALIRVIPSSLMALPNWVSLTTTPLSWSSIVSLPSFGDMKIVCLSAYKLIGIPFEVMTVRIISKYPCKHSFLHMYKATILPVASSMAPWREYCCPLLSQSKSVASNWSMIPSRTLRLRLLCFLAGRLFFGLLIPADVRIEWSAE